MDRDRVEVHKLAKKERGQFPAILTEQTWSIKDLLYGFRGTFFCGTRRVVTSEQDIEDITRWREDINFMFEWQEDIGFAART